MPKGGTEGAAGVTAEQVLTQPGFILEPSPFSSVSPSAQWDAPSDVTTDACAAAIPEPVIMMIGEKNNASATAKKVRSLGILKEGSPSNRLLQQLPSLMLREDLAAALRGEEDRLVWLPHIALLHPWGTDRHSRYGDADRLWLCFEHPLDIGGGYVTLYGI